MYMPELICTYAATKLSHCMSDAVLSHCSSVIVNSYVYKYVLSGLSVSLNLIRCDDLSVLVSAFCFSFITVP